MQAILKGSQVICGDCEGPVVRCDECKKDYVCGECGNGELCSESDRATCDACRQKEAAYWAWYFGDSIKAARDARESLGLSSSATESEVMDAARGLK